MRGPPGKWIPLGIAAQRVVEGVVVRNPHLAKTWIKLDPTAAARLGIPPFGEPK